MFKLQSLEEYKKVIRAAERGDKGLLVKLLDAKKFLSVPWLLVESELLDEYPSQYTVDPK